jgi:hypothetical protein
MSNLEMVEEDFTAGSLQAITADEWESYFSRSDTPSKNSSVGNLMVRVMAKYPDFDVEQARAMAKELLNTAAKAKNYRTPQVLSAVEKQQKAEQLKRAFGGS